MDPESLQRWQEAVEKAKAVLDSRGAVDPEATRQLARQLAGIQDALLQVRAGAISHKTLREAVGESLRQILETDRAELFPELANLAAGLSASSFDSAPLEAALVRTLGRELERQEAAARQRAEHFEKALQGRLDDLRAMVGSLPRVVPSHQAVQNVVERIGSLEASIGERIEAIGERSDASSRSLHARLERDAGEAHRLASRLDALEERLGHLTGRVAAVDTNLVSAVDSTRGLREEIARLRDELERRDTLAGDVATEWRLLRRLTLDLRDSLREGLEGLRAEGDARPQAEGGFLERLRRRARGAPHTTAKSRFDERLDALRFGLELALDELETLLARPPGDREALRPARQDSLERSGPAQQEAFDDAAPGDDEVHDGDRGESMAP